MQTQERPPNHISEALRPAPPLPTEGKARFLFGVATSDHQCEAFDPRYPDVWDVWEEERGLTRRGRAVDFWNRFREDIELARSIGCRAFRFSVSWARVEPRRGEWNEEALAHYTEVARTIREAGMEPVVTLMHWVWPVHVQERGGLVSASFPKWFRAYAAQVAEALGPYVRYWITLNEPNALPFGYIRFWWQNDYAMPPGLDGAPQEEHLEQVARVICGIFRSHTAAREEIRKRDPDARVSANPCVLGFPAWFQSWLDSRAIHSANPEQWLKREHRCDYHPSAADGNGGLWGGLRRGYRGAVDTLRKINSLGTLANTNWWFLGMAGKLPEFLCPRECVGQLDFVALDYYWGINAFRVDTVVNMLGAMQQQFGRAPIWSKGLYRELRKLHRLFPGKDILIAENGCPQRDDGSDRLTYITRHVGEVLRACRHGVPVIGYLCWSLTTCREWGLPEQPSCDFGLFRVDLDGDPELRRQPTPVSRGFADLIRTITESRK